jgi:hypothetical protein
VDVVSSSLPFVGSRALWDLSTLREIVLSSVAPATIGLSALGGALLNSSSEETDEQPGMHIVLGQGDRQILAALAPGLIKWVGVTSYRRLAPGSVVQFQPGIGTIALDGEREIEPTPQTVVEVKLRSDGPFVVDVPTALQLAARAGHLHRP